MIVPYRSIHFAKDFAMLFNNAEIYIYAVLDEKWFEINFNLIHRYEIICSRWCQSDVKSLTIVPYVHYIPNEDIIWMRVIIRESIFLKSKLIFTLTILDVSRYPNKFRNKFTFFFLVAERLSSMKNEDLDDDLMVLNTLSNKPSLNFLKIWNWKMMVKT